MKTFNANTVLGSADVNEYLVNTKFAIKPNGTTRTGTSPNADPDLSIHVDASKTYLLDLIVPLQASAAGGLKFNFASTGSNSFYGFWQIQFTQNVTPNQSGGTYDGGIVNNLGATFSITALSGGNLIDTLMVRGWLVTGGSAGNITLQWSQNSNNGNL